MANSMKVNKFELKPVWFWNPEQFVSRDTNIKYTVLWNNKTKSIEISK